MIAEQFRSLANTEIKDEYFDRYILLFDGLDEVKSKKDRIVFIEKINQYLTHKLNTHSIISSRNIDIFDDNLFDGYEHIELLPFDIGQAFKLVKKIIPDNKNKASQFVEAIRDQQLSNTLTRTPMALTLMAILYKEDAIDLKLKEKKLYEKMASILKPREREILILRFGLNNSKPLTQNEVANIFGISRSYVSRIETKAISKLAKEIKE